MSWWRFLLLALLLAALPASAARADGDKLRVFGFSPDGKRFAYEASAYMDTVDGYVDFIAVIDVVRANRVWSAYQNTGDEPADERAFAKVRATLRSNADHAVGDGGLSTYHARLAAHDPSVHPFEDPGDPIMEQVCQPKTRLDLAPETGLSGMRVELVSPPANEEGEFPLAALRLAVIRQDRAPVPLTLVLPEDSPSSIAGLAAVYVGAPREGQVPLVAIVNECHHGFDSSSRGFLMAVAMMPVP